MGTYAVSRSASACALCLVVVALGVAWPLRAEAQIMVKVLPDGSRMVFNAPPARAQGAESLQDPRPELVRLIERHARRSGLDPRLVRSVVQTESAYDAHAVSRKGAMGLMQLMPATARELGVRYPFDPDDNVRAGTTYLRRLLDRYQGRVRLALAAYNAGPAAVDRHGGVPPFRETRAYIARVLRLLASDGGRSADSLSRPALPSVASQSVASQSVASQSVASQSVASPSRATPSERGAPVYLARNARGELVFTTQAPRAN